MDENCGEKFGRAKIDGQLGGTFDDARLVIGHLMNAIEDVTVVGGVDQIAEIFTVGRSHYGVFHQVAVVLSQLRNSQTDSVVH